MSERRAPRSLPERHSRWVVRPANSAKPARKRFATFAAGTGRALGRPVRTHRLGNSDLTVTPVGTRCLGHWWHRLRLCLGHRRPGHLIEMDDVHLHAPQTIVAIAAEGIAINHRGSAPYFPPAHDTLGKNTGARAAPIVQGAATISFERVFEAQITIMKTPLVLRGVAINSQNCAMDGAAVAVALLYSRRKILVFFFQRPDSTLRRAISGLSRALSNSMESESALGFCFIAFS